MLDEINRRGFIRKSALIGTAGITGLLGTTGNAAAAPSGKVTVRSVSNSWDYNIRMSDPNDQKPPVEKRSKADSADSVDGFGATGNIHAGYRDTYWFPDQMVKVQVSPDGWDSHIGFYRGSNEYGSNVRIDAQGERYDYALKASEALYAGAYADGSDDISTNQVNGYVLSGGTDSYKIQSYIVSVYIQDPYSERSGLDIGYYA